MRQKAFDPLFTLAIAATLVAVLCILLVSTAARAPTLLWTDKDFANYWIASRLVLDGRGLDVFGPPDAYLAHLRAVFGADYPWRNWSYPPHYLLLILPLGLLPYKAALILFLLITFLLLCAAIRLVCRRATPWQILLLLPAIATNGLPVQNGYLVSALMLAGLALREKRPILAGICFGLLTIKPQLGVLLPVLLLWERQWRTIASACGTTVVLGLLSLALFGREAWFGYVANIVPYQAHVMREIEGLFLHMMPTVFGSARSLGFDAGTAFAAHLPFALGILALYGLSLFRLDRPQTRAASTLFATTLAVPYLVNYDLIALVACVVLLSVRKQASLLWRSAIISLAFIPMLTPLLGLSGLPVAPIIILASWLSLLHGEGVFSGLTPPPTRATA